MLVVDASGEFRLEKLVQRFSCQQLHRHVKVRAVAKELVHGNDVRMRKRLRPTHLPLQCNHRIRMVLEFLAEHLQCNMRIAILHFFPQAVACHVNAPHAANAELRHELIASTDDRANAENAVTILFCRGWLGRVVAEVGCLGITYKSLVTTASTVLVVFLVQSTEDAGLARVGGNARCRNVGDKHGLQRIADRRRQQPVLLTGVEPGCSRCRQVLVNLEQCREPCLQFLQREFPGEKAPQQNL